MTVLPQARASTLLVLVSLAGCLACASPGTPRFLADSQPLADGHHVDKSWSNPALIESSHVAVIELAEVDTSRIGDRKGITTAQAASALRKGILSAGSGDLVLSLRPSGRTARLEVAITEINPGNRLFRVIAAELGAGHAYVEVEARVVDIESGDLLAAVADRRRGTGSIGTRDISGDSGPAMVSEMLRGIGSDLVRELDELFQAASNTVRKSVVTDGARP